MMAAGFLIALGAFVPEPWGLPLLFVLVLAMTAVTTVYSRRFAREAAANPTGTGKII
jgi:membrane protein implicated in regulation of membrane protease activity